MVYREFETTCGNHHTGHPKEEGVPKHAKAIIMSGNANPYQGLFQQQTERYLEVGQRSRKERITKLKALKKALEHTYRQSIREALYADFKKPFLETDLTEIYPVTSEIKLLKKKISQWMKRKNGLDLFLFIHFFTFGKMREIPPPSSS